MQKYGFIYIWYDRKHKRYYIGAHWGKEDDGYICSSNWMKRSYLRRPYDFKRKIISRIYTNKKDMFEREDELLNTIKEEELGKRYYNIQNYWKHWSSKDIAKSVGEKISAAHKRHPDWGGWHRGKKFSEEHRQKLSESHKGYKQSEETIEKKRKKTTGKKRTKEFCELARKNKLGVKNPRFGQKWWTNGKDNVVAKECPDGFYKGRVL